MPPIAAVARTADGTRRPGLGRAASGVSATDARAFFSIAACGARDLGSSARGRGEIRETVARFAVNAPSVG